MVICQILSLGLLRTFATYFACWNCTSFTILDLSSFAIMLFSHFVIVNAVAFASMMAASSAQVTYNGTCAPNPTNVTYSGGSVVLALFKTWRDVYPCNTLNISSNGGGGEIAMVRVCGTSNSSSNRLSPVDLSGNFRYALPSEVITENSTDSIVSGQGRCNVTGNMAMRKLREIEVGSLAVSVVVASTGPAKACIDAMGGLTVAQLNWIFTNLTTTPNTTVAPNYQNPPRGGLAKSRYWSDLSSDPKCPATEIVLHGGTAFSTPMIHFHSHARMNYPLAQTDLGRGIFTSNDPVVVADQIAQSPNGIGFLFYHASVESNTLLHGVPISADAFGGSYIAPTLSGIRFGGNYPLLFPLVVYVHYSTVMNNTDTSTTTAAPRLAQVRDLLQFVLSYYGSAAEELGFGYVSLDTQRRRLMLCRLDYTEYCASAAVGTNAPVTMNPVQTPTASTLAPATAPLDQTTLAPADAPVGTPTMAPVIVSAAAPVKAPTRAPAKTPTRAPVKGAVLPAPMSALRPPAPTAAPQEPELPLVSALFAPLGNLFANLPDIPFLSDLPSLSELLCPPEFIQKLTGISC